MKFAVETIVSMRSFGMIVGGRILDRNHSFAGRQLRVRLNASVTIGCPVVGETWEIEGIVSDTAWGLQIEAKSALRTTPSGKMICAYLAAHIPGIGHERAEALWERFGIDIGRALSDPDELSLLAATIAPNRSVLGPRLAAACQTSWRKAQTETDLIVWLTERGINDIRVARTVTKVYGDAAVRQLRENPYCLVPLLPWAMVDRAGLQLLSGTGNANARWDKRRLVGAADEVVKQALRKSATAITDANLREQLARKLETRSTALLDEAMAAASANLAVIPGENGVWRAPGAATMEDYLVDRFRRMLDATCSGGGNPDLPSALRGIVKTLRIGGRKLHAEQCDAILRVLETPLAVLSGGAGVGKTAVTGAIADIWEGHFGGDVVLCAIAGKAALRLSQATKRLALTIARLSHQLQERQRIEQDLRDGDLADDEQARAKKRLGHLAALTSKTLLIVDEASMVDLSSLYRLVRHMPDGARLLLVGDEGQLPPVSFGILFHRLVLDRKITARLIVVHRQREAGGIPAVARHIREGHAPALADYAGPGEGVSIRRCEPAAVASEVEAVWASLGGLGAGTLVVTATWGGEAGVRALNERLQLRSSERGADVIKGHLGQWFSVGDPVMFLRNDYSRGLFNRMMGVVIGVDCDERAVRVRFDAMDEPMDFATDDLIDLALAYAITVHSSQGSQAPVVIIPLFSNRLMDPSLVYTAVTRAERQVVFVGPDVVIGQALARPPAATTRLVGFRWSERRADAQCAVQ